jgi:hypothetical protein
VHDEAVQAIWWALTAITEPYVAVILPLPGSHSVYSAPVRLGFVHARRSSVLGGCSSASAAGT